MIKSWHSGRESILGESGLAGHLQNMLAERTLTAESRHHLAREDQAGKNHRNGSSSKKVLTPAFSIRPGCDDEL